MTVRPGMAAPPASLSQRAVTARNLSRRSISPFALCPQPEVLGSLVRQLASFVSCLGRRALHFPARRPADGPARHQHDVINVDPEQIADLLAYRPRQRDARDRTARLDDDDDAVGTPRRRGAECDDPAAPHAGEAVDRPLEILRMILAPVDDDDVLGPATDI